ncbi:Hypothetical_protein [Hexamita inflata]|uniref:Hypothetical_protein n=1 Tax=Hexamita inflata TaxID=28002 RepID=A0AA86UWR1_9EUKA|nr:Hypothetical protein HINF_LOCUS39138 [Hexamita inflata]
MFVFKLIQGIDLYFSIVNGQIQLIDNKQQIISHLKTKYSFNPREEQPFALSVHQKSICKSEISEVNYQIPEEQFTNVHFCYGKTYFTVLDMIFVVTDNLNIKIVNQLPNYGQYYGLFQKLSHQGGNMFTINNKLYIHNNSTRLYQLKANNKLKCICRKHKNAFYYQFCDKVYAITMHDVYVVKNNLKLIRKACAISKQQWRQMVFQQSSHITMKHKAFTMYQICQQQKQYKQTKMIKILKFSKVRFQLQVLQVCNLITGYFTQCLVRILSNQKHTILIILIKIV